MVACHSLLSLLIMAMWAPCSGLELHAEHNFSLQAHSPFSSCPCLGWAETYRTKKAACGAHAEGSGVEMCTTFYEKIEDAMCLNKQQGLDWGQWCYVSAECMPATETQNGHVNDMVSWKTCTPEQDNMSREKTVEELMAWAQKNDIMPALLMKMVYPVYQGKTWEEVKPYIDSISGSVNLDAFPEDMRAYVNLYMESGSPVVFDSGDHHPPHGILEGHKIFQTNNNVDYMKATGDLMWLHPFQMNTCTLYKGH